MEEKNKYKYKKKVVVGSIELNIEYNTLSELFEKIGNALDALEEKSKDVN